MKITDPATAHGRLKAPLIQPSHRGELHRDLGVPQGQKIPAQKIAQAKNSPDPDVRRRATFAQNASKWGK